MAFTYDLSSDDATLAAVSQIRFRIGDTVQEAGPRPDDVNFSNEELQMLYMDEGSVVGRAVAAALEVLANEWSLYAGQHKLGPETAVYQQYQAYRAQAAQWRTRFGRDETAEEQVTKGGFSVSPKMSGTSFS